jgi:hypothetical protein
VPDQYYSDIEQKLFLMRQVRRLRRSLLITTDQYSQRGIQDEISALNIWFATIKIESGQIS